jgi:hypothetical protein
MARLVSTLIVSIALSGHKNARAQTYPTTTRTTTLEGVYSEMKSRMPGSDTEIDFDASI